MSEIKLFIYNKPFQGRKSVKMTNKKERIKKENAGKLSKGWKKPLLAYRSKKINTASYRCKMTK